MPLFRRRSIPNSSKWGKKETCGANPPVNLLPGVVLLPFLYREPYETQTPLQVEHRGLLYRHALEDPPGTSSLAHSPPPHTHTFNPRMCTRNTNLILSVLCLKLFGNVSHSQNETHAPYSVLCDLPPALVTSSHLIHTRCPLALLQQAQLHPLRP